MKSLRRRLPPFAALVTFEAAARHLNFTRAAAELGVTQAAVSRQIRVLEGYVGVALFRRSTRISGLTPAGHRLQQAVAMGLDHIVTAVGEISRPQTSAQVTITTTIALASVWLMPRIAKFRASYPDIDLKVIAADPILNLAADGIDVALRYGYGDWAGVTAERLFDIELFPVCSAAYLASNPQMRAVSDLSNVTLLHIDEPNSRDADWAVWFGAVGAKAPPQSGGLHFNNYPLLIQAALNGQGVALGWGHIVDDYLESGTLVRPFDITWRLEPAFYMALPEDVVSHEEVVLFCDWLRDETQPLRSG